MSCCGERRALWRQDSHRPAEVTVRPQPVIVQPTAVRFMGSDSIVVRGPVSGLVYAFAPAPAVLSIDGRDVDALVRTGRFRIA